MGFWLILRCGSSLQLLRQFDGYKFNFFNRSILFDRNDFTDLSGERLQPAIKTVFCEYLLNRPEHTMASSGKLVTFREFSGAGLLFSRFSENTNKTIEQSFSNRLAVLEEKCRQLFGIFCVAKGLR